MNRREREILQLIAAGLTNHEIGVELHLSEQTVKDYVKRILRTIGARNRTQAVTVGFREGLIS